MLTVTVELLHGTIRATGAADTALTGAGDAGEWPPSPARLFSALVAADGTGDRQRITDGRELRVLETAPPPRIIASRMGEVLRAPLHERFVVVDATAEGSVQEYAARKAIPVRPGTRLAPASATITYLWDVDADADTLRGLARRAARVGYLGCSDSPARVTVSSGSEPEAGVEAWAPSDRGRVVLPVPYDGFLAHLDDAFARTRAGEAVRRAWIPNRYVRYLEPGAADETAHAPVVLWLRFDAAVSGRRVLAVTETLRAAVLDQYTRLVGAEAVPAVLHGHGFEGRGYRHAQFVALPDVGHRHARGRLHGAAVILPPGTSGEVVEGVRTSLWQISSLHRPGVFHVGVRPHGGEDRPAAASPARWAGPATRWVSATPVVHERWAKRGPDLAEIERWCEHAGIDAKPVWFRTSPVPIVGGALALHPREVHRDPGDRRPYSHLEVAFDRRVEGPVVLGRGRHFGLGLMAPIPGRAAA